MDNAVKSQLQSVRFGDVQTFKNIAIVPLITPVDGTFQYLTLGDALANSVIAITEISAEGSVPDLMVVNRARTPILLIDGEELKGAKQNRVLNSSVLLKELSETKIPVSCTEQGRWAYTSQAFADSGNVMSHKARARKTSSVHRSLAMYGAPASDQGEVWDEVSQLQAKACCMSPTSAMSDVFKAREENLRQCEDVFKPVPNQVGLIAFIDGNPAGADIVSLTAAYGKLHPKLVRSYALEGLLDPKLDTPGVQTIGARARQFLVGIDTTEEREFPSVGYGTDYRFKGKALAGTALVHENEVIHAVFFHLGGLEQPERMASHRPRRRRFIE